MAPEKDRGAALVLRDKQREVVADAGRRPDGTMRIRKLRAAYSGSYFVDATGTDVRRVGTPYSVQIRTP